MSEEAAAISFGTDGWRATLSEFTTPRVRMVAQGAADYFLERSGGAPVAVGYDARPTSRGFADEVATVLAANGVDVWLAERDCPTPATAWTVNREALAGGIVITASHNPPEYNGIKFLPASGAPAPPDMTDAIADRLAEPRTDDGDGRVTERDLIGPYADHVLAFVDADLSGRRLAYDAMHGSGRGVTDAVLERAGATVTRIRCATDPEFGGTAPEPAADRVDALTAEVTDGDAALGLVNDGDADRIGVVTPDRGFLDPNLFFAAIYDYLLETEAGDVVRTVSTSSIVDRVAEAHGQVVHETPVGFKWVAQAMADHDALMGGEESGGFGLTAHLRAKDGVLLALVAAAADAERSFDDRVEDLLATHGEIHQGKVSLDCPDDRKAAALGDLETALPDAVAGSPVADVSTIDGCKVFLGDGGWLLVRPSGTEPKMRIYAEARSPDRLDELLSAGRDLVAPHL